MSILAASFDSSRLINDVAYGRGVRYRPASSGTPPTFQADKWPRWLTGSDIPFDLTGLALEFQKENRPAVIFRDMFHEPFRTMPTDTRIADHVTYVRVTIPDGPSAFEDETADLIWPAIGVSPVLSYEDAVRQFPRKGSPSSAHIEAAPIDFQVFFHNVKAGFARRSATRVARGDLPARLNKFNAFLNRLQEQGLITQRTAEQTRSYLSRNAQ